MDGIDAHKREKVPLGGNTDELRVATVLYPTSLGGRRAELLFACETEFTLATPPTRVDEDGAEASDLTRDLVAEYQRELDLWPASGSEMHVSVADTCAAYTDDHAVAVGRRFRPLLYDERNVEAMENRCAHG